MSVVIIDPLLRGLNDHHWSHVDACVDYCARKLNVEPVVYLPNDMQHIRRDQCTLRYEIKRPELSSYNEFDLATYIQFLVWFDAELRPSIDQILGVLDEETDLLIPNCTIPLLYSILFRLPDFPRIRSLRLYTVQIFLPAEPGFGIQLLRTLLSRASEFTNIRDVVVALPYGAYDQIKEGAAQRYWGDEHRALFEKCRAVTFPPVNASTVTSDFAVDQTYDLVCYGYPSPNKIDYDSLLELIKQGLSTLICLPENSKMSTEIIESLARLAIETDRVKIEFYGELSAQEFCQLAFRAKYLYLLSVGAFYSAKGGYSQRVIEALLLGRPFVSSSDSFMLLPNFDGALDGIIEVSRDELTDESSCLRIAGRIRNDFENLSERASVRRRYWQAQLEQFGFAKMFMQ